MLEEQFTEEKKQLKDLEEKLEVMALSYRIPSVDLLVFCFARF